MTDILDAPTRSRLMSRIRGKDTAVEWAVRRALHRMGLRFRLHVASLPGTPDIVLPRHNVCIFVNGCFWHAHRHCAYARLPSSNTAFWAAKLEATRSRDQRHRRALRVLGWRVIDIWECGIRDVRDPDLSWLKPAILESTRQRLIWPARPRKRSVVRS
jgi:DNA mismatch endonuclease (patch repair protein)